MANKYENVVNKFNENNCKLLNTKEDYIKIVKLSQNGKYKLNYIASCGHEHIVLYYVFKSRGTGIMCPSCKHKEIGINKKIQIQNNEISLIHNEILRSNK